MLCPILCASQTWSGDIHVREGAFTCSPRWLKEDIFIVKIWYIAIHTSKDVNSSWLVIKYVLGCICVDWPSKYCNYLICVLHWHSALLVVAFYFVQLDPGIKPPVTPVATCQSI